MNFINDIVYKKKYLKYKAKYIKLKGGGYDEKRENIESKLTRLTRQNIEVAEIIGGSMQWYLSLLDKKYSTEIIVNGQNIKLFLGDCFEFNFYGQLSIIGKIINFEAISGNKPFSLLYNSYVNDLEQEDSNNRLLLDERNLGTIESMYKISCITPFSVKFGTLKRCNNT